MEKKLRVRSNAAPALLRRSPRFKSQNPNQLISSSHRKPLSAQKSDRKSTPSSAKSNRRDSTEKDGALESTAHPNREFSLERRSPRLASLHTKSKDFHIKVAKKSTRSSKSRKIDSFTPAICPPTVRNNSSVKSCLGKPDIDRSKGTRKYRRLAQLSSKLEETNCLKRGEIGCASPRSRRSIRENSSQKAAILESKSNNNCSKGTRKSHRLAALSNKLEETNSPEAGKIGCSSQRRVPSENAAEQSAMLGSKRNNNYSEGTRKSHRLAALSNKLEENCPKAGENDHASQRHLPNICDNASEKAATLASKPNNNRSKGRRQYHRGDKCAEAVEISYAFQRCLPQTCDNASEKAAILESKPPLPRNRRRSKRSVNQSDEITRKHTRSKYVDESESDPGSEESPVGKKRRREETAETEAPFKFRIGELGGGLDNWTEEQEMALQNAYFLTRPSPRFWKKVSKMVPGKNAQECFDRIHSNFATPPTIPPKTRLNKASQMDSPFGKFNLLDPSAPKSQNCSEPKDRKVSKQKKTRDARKTLRHLLKKQRLVDQVQEADYFTQFEASPVDLPSDVELPSYLSRKERVDSVLEKNLKPGTSQKQPDPSPVVLKRVKNMELHEKYIDHLHCVDARRKACVRPCGNKGKEVDLGTQAGDLRDAKNALASEAQDFIGCFKRLQADPFGDCTRSDEEDEDDAV